MSRDRPVMGSATCRQRARTLARVRLARVRLTRFIAGVLLLAAVGCGKQEEEFLPVSGKVLLAGKLLTVGAVSFRPDGSRGNDSKHIPTGAISATGQYELSTLGRKGAPPGWYKVLVYADANALKPGSAASPLPPRWLMNVKYTDENTTDLAVQVVAKPAAEAYDLLLKK